MKKVFVTIIAMSFLTGFFQTADAAVDYRLIKTSGDSKIFLVKENRRIHIPNPSVFEAGGYRWGDVKTILQKEMDGILDTALIKSPVDAKVYLITDGKKAWIPNEQVFLGAGLRWDDIVLISQAQVDFYQSADFDEQDARAIARKIEPPKEAVRESAQPAVPNQPAAPGPASVPSPIPAQTENIPQAEPGQSIEEHDDRTARRVFNGGIQRDYPNVAVVDFGDVFSTDLNNDGHIVFANYIGDSEWTVQSMDILWDGNTKTYLPKEFSARVMNNNGDVAGLMRTGEFYTPVVVARGGVIKEIDIPHAQSIVDMNDAGDVLVLALYAIDGESAENSEYVRRFYLWNRDSIQEIQGFVGKSSDKTGKYLEPRAVNNKGQVVGWYQGEKEQIHAFLWDKGVIKDLHKPGCWRSRAYDINDRGQIFGVVCAGEQSGQYVVWEEGEISKTFNAVHPPSFYAGNSFSVMETINSRGDIAGYINYGEDQKYAALVTNGQIVDLNKLLPNNAGINFSAVIDINDNRQALVSGFNSVTGKEAAYLVTLPKNIPAYATTDAGQVKVDTESDELEQVKPTKVAEQITTPPAPKPTPVSS